MAKKPPQPFSPYGVAVGAAVLAMLLTLLLWPLTVQAPFLLFLAAVMVSAWYGGLGPGLLATALAAVASAYFLLPPFYSIVVTVEGLLKLSVFALVAVLIRALTDRRKQAEETERAQREYFQVTLASIGDAVIVTDATGTVTLLNKVAEELTGWTTDEAMGKPLQEVFRIENEETREPVDNPVAKVLCTGEIAGLANHTILIRKDGSIFSIDNSAAPILDELGHILGVIMVFRAITARKQAEAALRESEQRWRTLAEALPALVWMARSDGFLDYYNQRWFQYTGLSESQLAGWGWQAVWHLEDLPEGRRRWLEALRACRPYEYEARLYRAVDASYRWHLIRAVPVRDVQGRVLRWFGTNTDIEEQKRTAAELQRVNDELQQFSHIVSHDLNEPLRAMSSFATLLGRDYHGKLDATADEYITFISDAAQRMQQMIAGLLAYTRVGGPTAAFADVDGEALLAQVLSRLQLAIDETKAEVTHDPLPTVWGDETRLAQVLQNLIGNALKFRGQEPPRVHISVTREDHHWRFGVHDNGIGIDPRQASRLFQVFQRLHTQSEYPGTGIGLAICKKIVEQHGGRIWVESQPGQGATFHFTLVTPQS